ncbi:MAG: ATP phosphoribosyltransferase regulatory subunit [Lachnospiraceae bacterium]|nr:ATP phosphoribosyltransferase regulatory subunit [Lachnospiraceae bacterium]
MLNIKLHTPIGVRDILPKEAMAKKEVCARIEKVFEGYGYNAVESPMFEYIEVFSDEKMGSTSPKQMFRFFDRNGSSLALRSDMTPPIARIAATAYAKATGPLRFSYFGNAFRYSESYQGKLCEFPQAGIELMGVDSTDADAEVIALAVKSILATGVKEFRLHIGQVQFFKSILEETGLLQEDCNELKNMVAKRNYVGVESLIEDKNIDENIKQLFIKLPKMVGTKNVIAEAVRLTKSKEALIALREMENLYDSLKLYGVEDYVVFDLGMVNSLNYYTGIIFRGYTYGTGCSILDGGRYDNLVEQFGKKIPAVGFGIKVNEVLNVLENNKVDLGVEGTKAMVAYTSEGKSTALKIADIYRESGIKLENSLIGNDYEENLSYAKERGMESLLYFVDSVNIKYVKILDEIGVMTSDITIDDLVKPQREEEK